MIRVDLKEPQDDAWKSWRRRCEDETRLLVESVKLGKERRKVNEKLYKEQKKVLFKLYNEKCAYCESPFTRYSGDLDHFRPKNRITDDANQPVMVEDENGSDVPHPGYYWLTYDWRNLLPSCNHCNRPNIGASGQRQGKWDRFPVDGPRAVKPGDESRETLLLLYPASSRDEDDPARHLVFDETGVVGGSTEAAKRTIKLLGLNDDPLIDWRRETYRSTYDAARRYLDAIARDRDDPEPEGQDRCTDAMQGRSYYAATARQAIADCREAVQAGFARLFG